MESATETKELAKYGEIPEETLAILDQDAEGLEAWVRTTPEGFEHNGMVMPEIIGRLIQISPCWVKWENGKPTRTFDAEKPSDQYERRCEIKLRTRDDFIVGVSLSFNS
jgi:hypothetical protein